MNAVAVHCTQRETLALSGSELVTAAPLMIAPAQLSSSTLVSLSMDACHSITGDSILAVIKHFTQLHTLILTRMDSVSGVELMLAIPHLKTLLNPLLASIAEHMHMLEHIQLASRGTLLFSFQFLVQMVQASEKLKTLELQNDRDIASEDKLILLKQARPGLHVNITRAY